MRKTDKSANDKAQLSSNSNSLDIKTKGAKSGVSNSIANDDGKNITSPTSNNSITVSSNSNILSSKVKSNNNKLKDTNSINDLFNPTTKQQALAYKQISGIDSLYYFIESNEDYDDLYLDIKDSLESSIGSYNKHDMDFAYEDILITLNGRELIYSGKAMGFEWFRDSFKFFRIGFKDKTTNKNLHDIQVQLEAIGIYTVGLNTVIGLIDDMLSGYITEYKHITRADLNAFISYDFSFLTKKSFVSKKQKYREIEVFYNGKTAQTFYVGMQPFKLRLYDKKQELITQGKKLELMSEFFANNNLSIDSPFPIWNVEFELHRDFLKRYNIKTVDELLSNAVSIFNECMDLVRIVDEDSISDEMIASGHTNRANNLPIWDFIKQNYTLDTFMQNNFPLERVKRNTYKYSVDESIKEHLVLADKAVKHGIIVDGSFYKQITQTLQEKHDLKYKFKSEANKLESMIESKEIKLPSGQVTTLLLDKRTGLAVKKIKDIGFMSDYELVCHYSELTNQYYKGLSSRAKEKILADTIKVTRSELIKRELIEDDEFDYNIPF